MERAGPRRPRHGDRRERVTHDAARARGSTQPEMPTGQIVLQPPPQIEPQRGRQRRADERHPDARQPRARSCWSRPWASRDRRPQLHRRRHVPLRHARLHHRPARPAAEAARPAGDRLAHGVPPLPRQRPQGRPRGRRPAAPRADLAPPRPAALPVAGRGAVAGVGARHASDPDFLHVRYGVCAQPLVARAGAAGERRRSTRSTRPPRPPCTGCSSCTGCQPDLPASIDLRAFDRVEVCGPEEPARSLARVDDLLGDRASTPPTTSSSRCSARSRTSPTGTGSSGCRTPRAPGSPTPSGRCGWSSTSLATCRRCSRPTSATGRGSAPTSARRRRTSCW